MAVTRSMKLTWLADHTDLLAGVPDDADDVGDHNRPQLVSLADTMVRAKLYIGGHNTDRLWAIRRLVGEVRRATGCD